jgi:hypothetical protein
MTPGSSAAAAPASVRNPFPGLRPFQTEEAHLFHGRREQVNELLQRMAKRRFLAVVGTSGTGKSSLVRAGLLPALYRGYMGTAGSRWRIAVMRPGGTPLHAMAQALGGPDALRMPGDAWNLKGAVETLEQSSLGLTDLARQHLIGDPDNLLLIVDQFEEIFRFRRERQLIDGGEEAQAFVNLLLAAAEQTEVPVYVVLTMRSDFLGDCAQFPGLPEALNRNQYLVPRMTRAQRRQSIEGPLEVAGVPISQRLVQRILSDAGDNPENLPVMQHALMRTFEEWRRDGSAEAVDIAHYDQAGRIDGALHQHAEALWSALSPEQRACAARLFRCLTTSESGRAVRRPAPLGHFLRVAQEENGQELVTSVLETFAAPGCSFLTVDRTQEIGPASVVDISHESLITHWKRLDQWVKDESESADWYKRLVRAAELHAKGQARLWSDPDLHWAWTRRIADGWNPDWADQYAPGYSQAIAFLEESKRAQLAQEQAERERSERELRTAQRQAEIERSAKRNYVLLSVALAVFLAVAVLLAIQAQREKVEAHAQQKRAEALATQSDILSNRATAAERTAQAALKDLEAASARGDEAEKLRDEAAHARQQAEASEQKAVKLEQSKSSLSDQTSQTIETQTKQIAALRAQLEAQKSLPAAPVAHFIAEPSSIVFGQSAILRWQVSGQTNNEPGTVSIDQGLGNVGRSGSRRVAPSSSTVYTLHAAGPGGTSTVSVTVPVTRPVEGPPAPIPPPPAPIVVVLREWQPQQLHSLGFEGHVMLFITSLPSNDGAATLFAVAERPGGDLLPIKTDSRVQLSGDPALALEALTKKGGLSSAFEVRSFPLAIKGRIVQPLPDAAGFDYDSVHYAIKVTGKTRIGLLTDGAVTVVLYPTTARR